MKTIRGRKYRATVPLMHKNTTYVQCTDERVRREPQLHQGVICGDLYRNKATGDVDREANLCYFKICIDVAKKHVGAANRLIFWKRITSQLLTCALFIKVIMMLVIVTI
jgi:hypothetical protein